MRVFVYLPLLLPLAAAAAARPLAGRLPPRLATWLLTSSAVILAGASSAVLALLAAAGLARLPLAAALAGYSPAVLQHGDPVSAAVALTAALALTAAAAAAARMLWRRGRALTAVARQAACFPGHRQLVVLDEPGADAYAMPGLPGRIVVTTGMLDALDPAEREVLLAHERAHLTGHHYLFVAVAQCAATATPLLRPVAAAVTYTVERWADERAAAAVGDRRQVAVTVGKAALATRHARARRTPAIILGISGRKPPSLRAAGPVPRRVAALLAPPAAPRTPRLLPLAAAAAILTTAAASCLEAAYDLHTLIELARIGQ